jgi:hypothetical protein
VKKRFVKKRIAQPRIGKDGKYLSLFRTVTWSTSRLEGEDMEKGMGELYGTGSPSNSEIIESYENFALEMLEGVGFHHKKPFNFFDCYVIDGVEYSYFSPEGYKTAKELAEAQNLKPSGLLTGVVKRILNEPDWNMTIRGRAAKILDYCPGRAAKILDYCHFLKDSMNKGDIEGTVHNSMLLQHEVDTLSFMPFELAARIGEKQRNTGSISKYSDDERQLWLDRHKELGGSVRRSAAIIEAETGANSETVKSYLNKNK